MQKINITFFIRLGTRYFIIVQIFRKSSFFWKKKLRKTIYAKTWPFCGEGDVLQQRFPNTVFKFSPPKTPYLYDSRKIGFGSTFSPITVVLLGGLFPKYNKVHSKVDQHQPCKFHENRFKTAICIVRCVLTCAKFSEQTEKTGRAWKCLVSEYQQTHRAKCAWTLQTFSVGCR